MGVNGRLVAFSEEGRPALRCRPSSICAAAALGHWELSTVSIMVRVFDSLLLHEGIPPSQEAVSVFT